MTAVRQPRLSNILLIIIIVLMLAMIVLQVWHMIDSSRPVIRPRAIPTKAAPKLPGAFYEKYRNEQGLNTEQVFYFVV